MSKAAAATSVGSVSEGRSKYISKVSLVGLASSNENQEPEAEDQHGDEGADTFPLSAYNHPCRSFFFSISQVK